MPIYLILLIFPIINFKSLAFFTKFNALGTHCARAGVGRHVSKQTTLNHPASTLLPQGVVAIFYIVFFVVYGVFRGDHYANTPVGGIHFEAIKE